MFDDAWTMQDTRYWEVGRSRRGDWVVYDVRTDEVLRRFPTEGRAAAWLEAAARGDVW
jgi:hypothetical protein